MSHSGHKRSLEIDHSAHTLKRVCKPNSSISFHYDLADKFSKQNANNNMISIKKAKHAAHGLPLVLTRGTIDLDLHSYFIKCFMSELPEIMPDRRFIVKADIVVGSIFSEDDFLQIRFVDYYYPSFWISVIIDKKEKKIEKIDGRHVEATTTLDFYYNMNVRLIGVKRAVLRGKISSQNILSIWDEESDHAAFEIECDLTNLFH